MTSYPNPFPLDHEISAAVVECLQFVATSTPADVQAAVHRDPVPLFKLERYNLATIAGDCTMAVTERGRDFLDRWAAREASR